jgi:tRNA(fMet)-specific endonuclease VapC
MGLILDTSVLISAERLKFNLTGFFQSLPDESFLMCSITLSELWHGCHRASGSARQNRVKSVQEMESNLMVLEFGDVEARIHAEIWAGLEKAGQPIGLHDLIIGSTSVAHNFGLATLNEKEFKKIPGLRLADNVRAFLLA